MLKIVPAASHENTNQPFTLFTGNGRWQSPIDCCPQPSISFASLDAFSIFRQKLPLHDNLAWLLLDNATGEPAVISQGMQTILSAAAAVFGLDPLTVRQQQQLIAMEIEALEPLCFKAKQGEYRISFRATVQREISLPGVFNTEVSALVERYTTAGIRTSCSRSHGEITIKGLFEINTRPGMDGLCRTLERSPLKRVADCWNTAHGSQLGEGLLAALESHLERLDKLLYRYGKKELIIGADHPFFGIWLPQIASSYCYRDKITAVSGPDEPQLRLAVNLDQIAAAPLSDLKSPFVFSGLTEPAAFNMPASLESLARAGITTTRELAALLLERFNGGALACCPAAGHHVAGTRILLKDHPVQLRELWVPGTCLDIEAAMAAAGLPEFVFTINGKDQLSQAARENIRQRAEQIGRPEWFAAAYTAVVNSFKGEKLVFGNSQTLSIGARYTGGAGRSAPSLLIEIGPENRNYTGLAYDCRGEMLLTCLGRCINLAAYRAWVESHPDDEPAFIEDAIILRLEKLSQAINPLHTQVLEHYRHELELFCAAVNNGDEVSLTLPYAVVVELGVEVLFAGLNQNSRQHFYGKLIVPDNDGLVTFSVAAENEAANG